MDECRRASLGAWTRRDEWLKGTGTNLRCSYPPLWAEGCGPVRTRLPTTRSSSIRAGGVEGTGSARGRDARPLFEARQLVLRLPRQQVDQAALDALALEQRVVDLLGDGQLDASRPPAPSAASTV